MTLANRLSFNTSPPLLKITFEGILDDRAFDLKLWQSQLGSEKWESFRSISLDFSATESLSSRAVRSWIVLKKELTARCSVQLVGLPICWIDVWNQIPDMVGEATAQSFFAPYYCSTCQKEVSQLLAIQEQKSFILRGQSPTLTHGECGTLLDFDAVEETYFHAINSYLLEKK